MNLLQYSENSFSVLYLMFFFRKIERDFLSSGVMYVGPILVVDCDEYFDISFEDDWLLLCLF